MGKHAEIHNHIKANTNGFDKNPQNINRNGAPRKSFSLINKELKDKGIKQLRKDELIEAYSLIFNSTEKDLKEIKENSETPYAFKIIIEGLSNKKTREKAIADYRDYMFGKANQPYEEVGLKTFRWIENKTED